MNKYSLRVISLILIIVLFGGCSFKSDEGLFSLPNLPKEYVALQQKLSDITATGAQLAVAETGVNRQSVQLVDLDGDRRDEAIAFFLMGNGTIRAYAFKYADEDYEEIGYAESYGRGLLSVEYPSVSESGARAIAMSCSYEDNVTFEMTIIGIRSGRLYNMLSMQYNTVLFADADEDGVEEAFFAICNGATGAFSEQTYRIEDGRYVQQNGTGMSLETKSVANMQLGTLQDGSTALFIDSTAVGGGYVTDVVTFEGNRAINITVDASSGSGMGTWRSSAVYCADINADEVTDVPVFEGGELKNKITWKDYSVENAETVFSTYHNVTDKWYINWFEKWGDAVLAERAVVGDLITVTFYVPQLDFSGSVGEVRNAILTVYMFTGNNSSEQLKGYPEIKVLSTSGTTIYGCLLIENDYKEYSVTEGEVRSAFKVTDKIWNTEDY